MSKPWTVERFSMFAGAALARPVLRRRQMVESFIVGRSDDESVNVYVNVNVLGESYRWKLDGTSFGADCQSYVF